MRRPTGPSAAPPGARNATMAENKAPAAPAAQLDGVTYEVVRQRLQNEGAALAERVRELDDRRRALFGGVDTALTAHHKVRTVNACIARDLVRVGTRLLLGCDVRMGLK